MDDPAKNTTPGRRRKRRSLLRWFVGVTTALVVLLLLLAITVQIILSSTLPRRFILAYIERELGLRISAATMTTGWAGDTELRDVTVSLPLAQQAFLQMPTLRLKHSSLVNILLTRSLTVDEVDLNQPKVRVVQDSSGRWNLQDVGELLIRVGGKNQAGGSNSLPLPRISVRDGEIDVVDNSGRQATTTSVQVSGAPQGPLVWKYEGTAAPQLSVSGILAPGGTWKHRVNFVAEHLGVWAKPWIENWPESTRVVGTWSGEVRDGALTGRLQFPKLQVMNATASGTVAIRQDGETVVFQPEQIVLAATTKPVTEEVAVATEPTTEPTTQPIMAALEGNEIRLISGQVVVSADSVKAEDVQLGVAGGVGRLSGRWALAGSSVDGELKAEWRTVALPEGVEQDGTLTASVTEPFPNQPQIKASLTSIGRTQVGRWETSFNLSGQGKRWDAIDWVAEVPQVLLRRGRRSVSVSNLSARVTSRGSVLSLTSVSSPSDTHIVGRGTVNLRDTNWWLWLGGRALSVPIPGADAVPVDFDANAWGNRRLTRLDEFYVRSGTVIASGNGWYNPRVPKPLDLDLWISDVPAVAVNETEEGLLRGRVHAGAHLNGTASPLEMSLVGELNGQDVFIRDHPLGDIRLSVNGEVDSEHASVKTIGPAAILGGKWNMWGLWPAENNEGFRVNFDFSELPLAELGQLAQQKEISGTASGQLTVDLIPHLRKTAISAIGNFKAEHVKARQVSADLVEGDLDLRDGRLKIGPLAIRRGEGRIDGHAEMDDIAKWRNLTVTMTANAWPVPVPDTTAQISVSADTLNLAVNLGDSSAVGSMKCRADVTIAGEKVGEARAEGELTGRTVGVHKLHADLLGGTADGQVDIDLDDLLKARADIKWSKIEAARLVKLAPQMQGLSGTFAGSAKLAPDEDPRAVGPLRLELHSTVAAGDYRTLPIGDAELFAYFDTKPLRFVLDQSMLQIDGGKAELWARATEHGHTELPASTEPSGTAAPSEFAALGRLLLSSLAQLDFKDLDLDRLVHVISPQAQAYPGKLHGTLRLVGNPLRPRQFNGSGTVRLTESNLYNLDFIRGLAELLHISKNGQELNGTGSATVHYEADTLDVTDARYINNSFEVRAMATIAHVSALPKSPISGSAVGSAQPFAKLGKKLPFLADVDQVLGVVQSQAQSVVLFGTVDNIQHQLAAISELGNAMKSMIVGDVQAETKTSTSR